MSNFNYTFDFYFDDDVESSCVENDIFITWLNYLGGFSYWNFTPYKDYGIDVDSSQVGSKNLFNNWPNSYNANADTVRFQSSRTSTRTILFRSQYLTKAQVQAVANIKTSILVQIINGRGNRLTIIPDTDSFTIYSDGDKLYTMTFLARYTNEIGTQKL